MKHGIFQVRSFSAMFMVVLTAPLGLAGVVPTLLLFHQPFGFNAILGLIALAGNPDAQYADPHRSNEDQSGGRP